MTKEERKIKNREKMRKWRLANPEKEKALQKKYDANPKRLESKRRRMAEWRKNNPDKQKEIANRSYLNCRDKNRDKKNEAGRIKWRENEALRQRVLKKAREKYLNNRELYCVTCGVDLPKHSSKYCDKCKDEEYKRKGNEWKAKVGKDYVNALQNKARKVQIDALTDGYIAMLLRGNKLAGLRLQDIPKELIEIKRKVLKIKRITKIKKP